MLTKVEENDPLALSAKHLRYGQAGCPATDGRYLVK
jgi:hypothetical protein